MAIFSLSTTARTNSFSSRLKSFLSLTKLNHSLGEVGRQGQLNHEMDSGSTSEARHFKISNWTRLDSREMGIARSMIPEHPWIVLKTLQTAGFEAYLVGGCVRDLLLKRVPKDYDVITTADLTQIKKKFRRCMIVGRRFPICKVKIKGSVVEVSSFATVAKTDKGKEKFSLPSTLRGLDPRDIDRWRNCMYRDFTVNSLFFDPFVNKIYDYANAMVDIRSSKLRTLVSAEVSFGEDSARILRGLRLAARLNFSFSKEADSAIRKHSSSILRLDKSRILMEMDYMLSFGAAEASIYLLHRYHLLKILLPVQAAHLAQHDHGQSGQSPLMLMKLFSNLDRLVSCERPTHGCLWVAILTFHLALINNPQQALVILAFASLLYHGSWDEGVRFARQHVEEAHIYVPEISDCSHPISDDELVARITQFARHVKDTVNVFTQTARLEETMVKFPGFPCSNLVFVTKKIGDNVRNIFNILLSQDVTTLDINRQSLKIDYGFLLRGKHTELGFVLGKIILNTLGCGIASEEQHSKEEKHDFYAPASHKKREAFLESLTTNLGRCHSTGKEVNKRRATSTSSEQMHEVVKKQKVMLSNNYLSEGATNNLELVTDDWPEDAPTKDQDFFEEDYCLRTAKKHQAMLAEGIDTVFQASKMQIRRKTRELRIKSSPETVNYKMTPPGQPEKDQKPDHNPQLQYSSEQSKSVEEKADKITTSSQTKEAPKEDVKEHSDHKRSHKFLSSLFR